MIKRTLALAAVLLLTAVGTAQAGPYPPAAVIVTAPAEAVHGSTIAVSAQTFRAHASVAFTLKEGTTLLASSSATASSAGAASSSLTLPSTTGTKTYTITASGLGTDGTTTVSGSTTITARNKVKANSAGGATVAGVTVRPAPVSVASSDEQTSSPSGRIALGVIGGAGLLALLGNRHRRSLSTRRANA